MICTFISSLLVEEIYDTPHLIYIYIYKLITRCPHTIYIYIYISMTGILSLPPLAGCLVILNLIYLSQALIVGISISGSLSTAPARHSYFLTELSSDRTFGGKYHRHQRVYQQRVFG